MQFAKYHGLGNDYIVLDPSSGVAELDADAIRRVCDRHLGPGSDGILWGPFPHCPVGGATGSKPASAVPHGTACTGESDSTIYNGCDPELSLILVQLAAPVEIVQCIVGRKKAFIITPELCKSP